MSTAEVFVEIYTNILGGYSPVAQFQGDAVAWRQSWRDGVGPETAHMRISDQSENVLAQWFFQWLGYHAVAWVDGMQVWEGLIYEMDMHAGAVSRRRSLADMYNYVRCSYIDNNGISQMTGAQTDSASIARYGRRENIVTLEGYNTTSATQYAATALKNTAYPWARPSGMARGQYLDITLAGYATTANWRYVSVGDSTTSTASAWLSEIASTDIEYMASADIDTNSLSVVKVPRPTRRVWNTVQEIAALGDGSSNAWRAYFDVGRVLRYEQIDTAPRYMLTGDGQIRYYPNGAVASPWFVRPAVVRDMTYLVRPSESGSWLADPRDAYMTSVTVNAAGELSLRFGDYDDVQIADAMAIYRAEIERAKQ